MGVNKVPPVSMTFRGWTTLACLALALSPLPACKGDATPEVRTKDAAVTAVKPPPAVDAGPPPAPKPPPGPPKRLFAKKFVAKVREAPKKEAFRIGYLRGGSVLMAKTGEPIGFEKCRKGWFELETGGFICSTVDAVAFLGKRLPERRATQPDLEALLPYPYGYSRRKGTPVYKRLPNDEEAAQFEGYRIPGVPVRDAGVVEAPQAAGAPAEGAATPDAGVATLASLQGEVDSVLLRRMERGFYVSLDREMKRGRRKYWRTQANGFIPHRRLLPVKGKDFAGTEIVEGEAWLPIAYVLSSKYWAWKLNKHGRLRRAGKPGYHHRFRITGEATIKDKPYVIDADGVHYRAADIARIDTRPRPKDVLEDEKWIDINLANQTIVAYVGDRPVYASLVSTGRVKDEDDPLKNFETPVGGFRITSKHLTATMDGDHALDGPYSIEDVPYVMYFQLAFALHSAFWHNSFGRPRSHGCINLAPTDARWMFNFATPDVPKGWHGRYPTDTEPGTRLYIHGETPRG